MTKQEVEEVKAIVREIVKEEIQLASGERNFPLPALPKISDEPKKVTRRTNI